MDKETRERMASSASAHWCTPEKILEPIRQVNTIALDPCSNLYSIVEPKKAILPPQDGLALCWKDLVDEVEGGGLIFCNPPYGKEVRYWIQKCAIESARGCEIVLLTAARTETKYFQNWVLGTAQRCCLLKGRVTFIDGTGQGRNNPAFFPSALTYWGPNPERFDDVFKDKGYIIKCDPNLIVT